MPWITIIVLAPLAGALWMLLIPPGRPVWARVHAVVMAAFTLVVTGIMVGLFDRGRGSLQFVDHLDWAREIGLSWDVGVDGISLWLLALTSALFFVAILVASLRGCDRPRAYLGLLLLAEAGLLGVFAAGDLVLFYVFFEAMLVPFYFLIGLWGDEDRRRAVTRFVVYTMFGSLLMLVAVIGTAFVAYDVTGQFTFSIRELQGVAFSPTQSTWLFAGFALAFAIKLPLFPFHGWMPMTYRSAPILVTGLLAAVMSKAGAYGLLRIAVPLFPRGADRMAVPLMVLALMGIVYGSLVAWRAATMRMLVAYSSLAHLGFIVLGIMAFDIQAAQGAVMQMVNHGIVVAAAFAVVGIIGRGMGTEQMDRVGGLARGAPWLAGTFLIVAMASLAIPGSNAFAGEFLILAGTFRHHVWAATLACIGVVYAAVYMLRLYQSSMNGPALGGDARRAELGPLGAMVLVPLIGLMGLLALWPQSIVGATRGAVARAVAGAQAQAGRPASEIESPVPQNPPAEDLPLPSSATSAATP